MAWNTSLLSGPHLVPIYGAATSDGHGGVFTPVTGHEDGVVFVLPADRVTAGLQAYAEDVPAGVPVLEGVPSKALRFASEEAAKGSPLAAFWTPDTGAI